MDEIGEKDFVVIDEFLDPIVLATIHTFFNKKISENDFKKAAIGTGISEQKTAEIRGDYTYWLKRDTDTSLNAFFEIGDDIIFAFNKYCYLSLKASEFHLAEYPIGSFYKPHRDQFEGSNNRIITFLLYLNKDWGKGDGGELRIHTSADKIDISPHNNRCVLFNSEKVLHEVLPTNTVRRSLTGWLLYNPSVLGRILK